jgi:D-sedoheptulose 7-phosphate isomerase
MENTVIHLIKESINVKATIITEPSITKELAKVSECLVNVFKNKNKLMLCGNGGSAADAQHIAAELSGRFYLDRPPLDAEALHVNSSYLTAVANDYSFDVIYSRMVEAKAKKGDALIAISTSGNSKNIIQAVKKAKELGVITIGFTGEHGGELKNLCDYCIQVPSNDTPRIQECHILFGHILCEIIEGELFQQ